MPAHEGVTTVRMMDRNAFASATQITRRLHPQPGTRACPLKRSKPFGLRHSFHPDRTLLLKQMMNTSPAPGTA